jgi:hypothetical protein
LENSLSSIRSSVLCWLPAIYSTNKGIYRLSSSAFHPFSVDATSLAVDLHLMLGLELPNLDSSLAFFDAQQEDATGFYYEPFVAELDLSIDRILEMSGTYFGYQVSAVLLALGRPPRYPYRFYDQFLPSGRMDRYMSDNMPWARAPMGAGNMVDHGATMMRANIHFGDERYRDVLQGMYQWLDAHQDPVSGLWGNGAAQGRNGLVQGGYHLMRGLYFQDRRAPNYAERIIDTTLASIDECDVFRAGNGEGCHDMDHFVVLERMLEFTNGYRENDIRAVCQARLEQILQLRRDDGGFSFEAKGSITNHNRYEVTSGKPESDLVGTVFYLETLYRINKVLDMVPQWSSSVTHGVTNESS